LVIDDEYSVTTSIKQIYKPCSLVAITSRHHITLRLWQSAESTQTRPNIWHCDIWQL